MTNGKRANKILYFLVCLIFLIAINNSIISVYANTEVKSTQDSSISMWDGSIQKPTENDNTYVIYTASELAWIAEQTNNGNNSFAGAIILLNNDIDLSGHEWTAIGNYTNALLNNPFEGTFDGQGHVITGMKINKPTASRQGLFGYTDDAIIRNIGVINYNILGKTHVGGLIGHQIDGTVSACYTFGIIKGESYAGGIIGYLYGNDVDTNITDCYTSGNVSGNNVDTGGLIGYVDKGVVSTCYTSTKVSGSGALIGKKNDGKIINSYWDSDASRLSFSDGGIQKSSVDLITELPEGFNNKNDVWGINPEKTYPYLKNIQATQALEITEDIITYVGKNGSVKISNMYPVSTDLYNYDLYAQSLNSNVADAFVIYNKIYTIGKKPDTTVILKVIKGSSIGFRAIKVRANNPNDTSISEFNYEYSQNQLTVQTKISSPNSERDIAAFVAVYDKNNKILNFNDYKLSQFMGVISPSITIPNIDPQAYHHAKLFLWNNTTDMSYYIPAVIFK